MTMCRVNHQEENGSFTVSGVDLSRHTRTVLAFRRLVLTSIWLSQKSGWNRVEQKNKIFISYSNRQTPVSMHYGPELVKWWLCSEVKCKILQREHKLVPWLNVVKSMSRWLLCGTVIQKVANEVQISSSPLSESLTFRSQHLAGKDDSFYKLLCGMLDFQTFSISLYSY